MDFDNQIPEWKNSGVEPSDNLKTNGFPVKLKPPADIFNWFWSKVTKAIKELQTKLKGHAEDKTNPHGVTKTQVGLDKVDNTSDSEKSVKTASFASEAGVARKAQNALTVRFKGGNTEGTNKWTFDGSTSKSVNITPANIGAATEEALQGVKDTMDTLSGGSSTHNSDKNNPHGVTKAQVGLGNVNNTSDINKPISTATQAALNLKSDRLPVAATSTDGINYTATINGITELSNGLTITIIPNMLSASKNTTLNVNGLGAKPLRCSLGGYNFGNSGTIAALDGWLGADSPVTIQYKSKFDNWQTIIPRPSVSGLYGTVKVEQGGTGATTAEGARENLGLANCAKIAFGFYQGKGTYGSSNPNTISCDFKPLAVFIQSDSGAELPQVMMIRDNEIVGGEDKSHDTVYQLGVTWNDNSVSWYTYGGDPSLQFNDSMFTYRYVVIGE